MNGNLDPAVPGLKRLQTITKSSSLWLAGCWVGRRKCSSAGHCSCGVSTRSA